MIHFIIRLLFILGLQPIPGDPKDNGVAAMLDDRTFCFVIQHGRHAIVFLDLQGLVANQECRSVEAYKSKTVNICVCQSELQAFA